MVSIEPTGPHVDERMSQHVVGESWAVGVAKTPRQNFFSETCDARALPLVGGGGELMWKEWSR